MKILLSFLILYVGGLYSGKLVKKIHLPPLIGMIIFGCIANVYLKIIDPSAIEVGKYIKNIALVIVLLIGGLGIKLDQIKRVGRPAILLSVVPAFLEGMTIAFISMKVFGFTFIQGGILGFIIAAVSPAVLVPAMVDLISRRLGEKKAIPQMLLTGASADDSIAIALFTSFLSFYFGKGNIAGNLIKVPIAVVTGILVGIVMGFITGKISEKIKNKWIGTLIVATTAIFMRLVEEHFQLDTFNSLLGVMTLGFIIANYFPYILIDLTTNLKKLWSIGSIFLFTLVGGAINPTLIGSVFITGTLVIFTSLFVRSIGVLVSLIGTNLNSKERAFCVIAYLPKATVQSAKAGIPLQMGVAGGELIQALSILAVVITAPIGAIGIKLSADRFLEKHEEKLEELHIINDN